MARNALSLIHVYYGEKHGKSHADALFGHLKSWMSYKIKARNFIVKNAHDFYKYCREFCQTPVLKDCCQHYCVEFQFIRQCDVKGKQDCDLESHIEGTQDIYSVHNTPQPVQLQVRAVPCLCPPCISEQDECLNSEYTEPWRLVELIPKKGDNPRKYAKRQKPVHQIDVQHDQQVEEECQGSNDDLSEISIDVPDEGAGNVKSATGKAKESTFQEVKKSICQKKQKKKEKIATNVTDHVTDPENVSITAICPTCSWVPIQEEITEEDFPSTDSIHANDEEEMINICAQKSTEFLLSGENALRQGMAQPPTVHEILDDAIPEEVFWYSILSAIESCRYYIEVDKLTRQLIYSRRMPVIQKRSEVYFILELDVRDMVTQCDIPPDDPVHMNAVYTEGDGNCFCRALSKAFFNTFSRHIEIRARIVLEGIINKSTYAEQQSYIKMQTYPLFSPHFWNTTPQG